MVVASRFCYDHFRDSDSEVNRMMEGGEHFVHAMDLMFVEAEHSVHVLGNMDLILVCKIVDLAVLKI